MPLINCPDCKSEVSDRAATCIKCGAPITTARETSAIGTPVTTTQGTSKSLKLQSVISTTILIVGTISALATPGTTVLSALLIVIGLIWLIVTRIRIWWHHD